MKKSDRAGLQDSGKTTSIALRPQNKDNRITDKDEPSGMGDESSDTDDSVEPTIDGEFSRRTFLGAAAALAVLPQTTSAEASNPSPIIEDRTVTDDGTYSVTDCGSVPGGLNNIHVQADMNNGPLEVEGIHEKNGWSGVGLRWSSGSIEVGTGLDPDDARDLAARLVVAADAAEGKFDD